jgi:hypothetical protein
MSEQGDEAVSECAAPTEIRMPADKLLIVYLIVHQALRE